ncbi:MAG: hypothetical protein VX768_11935 [Planctomycetota bacterium]|nr:hypothetical protein [Planctomycetota bacterium]
MIPFDETFACKALVDTLFSPLLLIFLIARMSYWLFWPTLAGLLFWRMVEWQKPFGCQIDVLLILCVLGMGMLKFYWWAVTLGDRLQTRIEGIEDPVEEIETLTDKTAYLLSQHKGDLNLYCLTQITGSHAAVLARHKGTLDLSGLESLTDDQAASLSSHEGILILGSIRTLSDLQADSLSRHKGELYLGAIESLSESQLDSFRSFSGIHLELPEPFSETLDQS